MALPSRPMHVPAGVTFDEATRPELLDVGGANVANRNVRIDELGTLTKRLGFASAYGGVDRIAGTDRTTGRKLFAHGDASVPCVIDGTFLDVYSSTAQKWRNVGRIPEAVYSLRSLPTPIGTASLYDTEVCAGAIAVMFGDGFGGACYAVVVDADTGALLAGVQQIGSGDGYLTVGSVNARYFVACMYETAGAGSIKTYIFDVQNLAAGWVFSATVASATSANPAICSVSNRVLIAYGTSSGTTRVSVKAYDQTGLLDSTTFTEVSTPQYLDIDAASGTAWVAWDDNAVNARVIARSATSLATSVGTAINALSVPNAVRRVNVCAGTATTARIWCIDTLDIIMAVAGLTITTGAVAVDTDGDESVYNTLPVSRPFYRAGRYYMAVAPSPAATGGGTTYNNSQGLCILVDWTETAPWMRPVVNIEPGLCPAVPYWNKARALDANRYVLGIQVLRSGSSDYSLIDAGNGTTGCVLAEIDFGSRDRFQTVEHHGVTIIGGGVVSAFDGTGVAELGFTSRPRPPARSSSGTGITGTYIYVAIYEDTDASGNVAVSGVSLPSAPIAVTNKTITVTVPPLAVTSRLYDQAALSTSVRVAWYRTATGGEPPYYRLGSTASDPTQPTVSFADDVDDTVLATRAKLYAPQLPGTVGESLDRRAPPGLRHVVSFADMLVGSKGDSLFYSGQPVYGEATWFSPVFEVPLSGGGEVTALAVQDGNLVVFKRGRIYIVPGEIPSDNGAAGGLGQARLISSDVGCIDATSVVATSLGVFFQSERGLEIFTRSQTVEWLGEPIQDTLAAYPYVTSAVVDIRNSLVRFSLAGSLESDGAVGSTYYDEESQAFNGVGGRDCIFDLALKMWVSVDTKATGDVVQVASQHAGCVGGRYAWLSSAGVVYLEKDADDATAYLDDTTEWITAQYELPPWKLGLAQDHRIYEMMLVFQRHSEAGLTIEVAEDYGAYAAVTPDKVWTAADLAGVGKISFRPRERGHAVQLRVRDTAPVSVGSGRGFTWLGFSADIAPKQGPTKGTPRINTELRR